MLNSIKVMTMLVATLLSSQVMAQTTNTNTTMPAATITPSTSSTSATTTTTTTTKPAAGAMMMPTDTSDASVLANVQTKIIQDSMLAGSNVISISISQGVVTLSGSVGTQMQADAAMSAAKAVPGVKSVTSNITVKSATTTTPGTMNTM